MSDDALLPRPFALGFDFDHTLGSDQGLERRAFYELAVEAGVPIDPDDPGWQARLDELLELFRSERITLDAMLARFSAALGVLPLRAERWQAHCFALVDQLVRPLAGARELLTALRARGVPHAILTNGWSPLQEKKIARALGESVVGTSVLVSDLLGVAKPAPGAFAALTDELGMERERCWYVGDNPQADVGGALAAGLRAIWLDEHGASYPQDVPRPTVRVTTLRELQALIENTFAP
ncbi:MAG TPA: HAD family hydrolase [Candidatus Sulfotelmatobacter sp.]|nr:HAD family hydrolase [Candidatus Sulfotelmatobacter sp.]